MFHASGGNTATLDLASATWTQVAGGAAGGSAGQVLHYAPGRLMRCGGNSRANITDVIMFGANDQTSGWVNWTLGQMQSRILHRATLLPTGDVLVTGGVRDIADTQGTRIPQLWNETTGWGDAATLDPEPVLRSYHGTAILLPDGRVFTAGGSTYDASPYQGWVYEPPYLFDVNGQYVRQTIIAGARRISQPPPPEAGEVSARAGMKMAMARGMICRHDDSPGGAHTFVCVEDDEAPQVLVVEDTKEIHHNNK